ncbi:hypothetical protein IW139_002793 [Coemansia sp. RSA 353]|nr:hypothetical protein GGH17_001695 [Coemansia sp. RSA 788]KAJ2175260.1 hypothetical protein GGH16_000866 [Coemansia sp. RSA 560]KAJ2187885.1 hypothetical protein EV181_002512 [Coemansia sp. RSA 532]KAJ2196249.1 hypothetical protein IW144_003030 [Coemansia sp. RSA 522]KAJ2196343.1 hypothetical protein GGH18_001649 [Coemansia sp. RSA 530]KAJ2204238.1 hypothetical protein IW145_003564 [Coemansia sp. RSA 521]KAJ2226280.1 hypothetical protein EV180_003004 [Coemansia sp. RSA 518]KAJ2273865.1 hyp
MMRVVARRLAYPLNDRFWRGLYAYTRDNCYLEQNRSPMNRASGSEDDVYVSEDEHMHADDARLAQSDDEDEDEEMHADDVRVNQSEDGDEDMDADDVRANRSGSEETHPGPAESSETTVLNISANLLDMRIEGHGDAPATHSPIATDAATHSPTATDADISALTATDADISAPIATDTATHAPTASDAATHSPTASDAATHSPTASDADISTPTASDADISAPTATDAMTHSPTVTDADISAPTATDAMTHGPTASDADISAPTASDADISAPTATDAMTHSPTATDAMTHSPTATDAMTHSPTVTDAATHSPTASDADISAPTASDTATHAPAASDTTTHDVTMSDTATHDVTMSDAATHGPTTSDAATHGPTTSVTANRDMSVVTHTMTLAPKRPRPGSKCVDEPATKKVAINPLAAPNDTRDQELEVILADYPDKRPAMTSRMRKLAVALYAETPDVGGITKLLNTLEQTRAPAHDRVLAQTSAPRVGPARPVTLKDISKAVGNGIAVMNLVQVFEYVLWVAKWEVALKKHYPNLNHLFMEMLPVVDIAHGQQDGQTIYKLTGPLMQQANYAAKYDKAANEMMGETLTKRAYGGFNRQLATAKVFVYIALMGRGKFDRICCQTLNKSTLRDLLPIVLQDYKLFQFVVKKANINYNCARLGIKDAQTWGAVCDLACHTGSTMFVDIVKQDKAVEEMMDRFVKNLL